MAVILNNKKSTYGSPYCYYTVEYTSTSNRTATTVDIAFKVTSHLAYSSSSFGTGRTLKAQLYINGVWSDEQTLKASNESWSGTSNHTKTFTLTIENLSSSTTTLSGVQFKVKSSASDSASGLNATSCSDITIPSGHQVPTISSYTMTEINSALSGVSNNVIVEHLSKKRFTINYTTYDSATIIRAGIYNSIYPYTTTTLYFPSAGQVYFELDCSQFNFVKDENNNSKIPIVTRVIDSQETQGLSSPISQSDLYSYIAYTLPTINESETIVKRIGQTSGKVGITVSGTYYFGTIGNTSQVGSYKPTIKYKYWENGASEPSTYANTIPSSNITISNGIFSVSNYNIGSETTSATNYFDPEKSYRVKIQVSDSFKSVALDEAKSVPVGEALWTEYKDRLDFKAITKQNNSLLAPISLYEDATGTGTGNITLKVNNTATSCENFEYIEIFYRPYSDTVLSSYRSGYGSVKVHSPNGKKIQLLLDYDNGTYWYHCFSTWTFNTTTLTKNNEMRWRFGTSGSPTRTDTTSSDSNIYIYKIVGYK